MTVMGDAAMNRLSDRGSIPLSSTNKDNDNEAIGASVIILFCIFT